MLHCYLCGALVYAWCLCDVFIVSTIVPYSILWDIMSFFATIFYKLVILVVDRNHRKSTGQTVPLSAIFKVPHLNYIWFASDANTTAMWVDAALWATC